MVQEILHVKVSVLAKNLVICVILLNCFLIVPSATLVLQFFILITVCDTLYLKK